MRPRRFLLGAATAVLVSCLIVTISIDAVAAPRAAHGQTRVVLRPPKLPKKQPAKKGTAWAKVLDQIAPDGQVSTKTALQAFAIAIAPLPGVHPPRGPPGTGIDGGEAVRWVIAHWADLTPKQQAVVQKVLTGTPVPQTSGPGRSLPMKGTNVWPVVTEMLARYDAPLGHLPIPVTVEYLGGVPQGAPAATEALAEPVNSTGGWSGAPATCQVQITPAGAKASGPDFEMVIAHELFHCYQAVWMGDLSAFYALAHTWVLEGSATWAGYNVAPDPPSDENNHWPTYLESPSKPLFQREHDAVGFFGQVAQWGVDLWPLFPKFFQTSGDVARYQMLVDATGGALLDAWGPGYWMNSRLAEAWRVEGKAVPPAQPISGYLAAPQAMVVADHTTQNVAAKPYTVAMYGGTPTADVTEVQIGGHARLADGAPNGETFDTTQLSDTYLCTKADHDCSCPDDTDSAGNDLPASIQKVEGFLRLGLTGASDGATGTLTGLSLKDFCKKRNHKKATTACDVLTIKDIDTITGLHITSVKDNGDACVFTDPSAPVNSVLQSFASVISKAFTGSGASIDTGAGVIVRLQTLPAGPEPQVQDYFGEIPEGLCDAPQLIDGVNGATAICQGVENIVVVSNGKFVHIVYLASADSATHEQGAALGQAADDRL